MIKSSNSNVGEGTHADTYASDPTATATRYCDWTTTSSPPRLPTQAIAEDDPISANPDAGSSSVAVPPNQSLRTDSSNISVPRQNSRVSVPENSRRLELDITPSSSRPTSPISSPARSLLYFNDEVENDGSARSFDSTSTRSYLSSPRTRNRPGLVPPKFGVPLPVSRLLRSPRGNSETGSAPIISMRNALVADEIDELMGNYRKTTSSAFRYTTLKGTDTGAIDIRFSPDSKSMITYDVMGTTVGVWDVEDGSLIDVAKGGCLTFSPDAHRLAVVNGGLIRIWTSRAIRPRAGGSMNEVVCRDIRFPAAGKTLSLALSLDGERVASASSGNTISVFDVTKGKMIKKLKGPRSPLIWVCFCPSYNSDVRRIVALFEDGQFRIWDEVPRKIFGSWAEKVARKQDDFGSSENNSLVDGATATAATMHAANPHLAVAANDGKIYIWRCKNVWNLLLLEEMVVTGHEGKVSALALAPDSSVLASASRDAIKLWRVQGGLPITTIRRIGGCFHSLAFSPDAQSLASIAADDRIRVWNATRIQDLTDIQHHLDEAVFLATSPDGRYVASVTQTTRPRTSRNNDQESTAQNFATIMVWDVENIRLHTLIRQHETNILALSFSVDSLLLGSISLDHVARIWDVKTGKCLKTLITPKEVDDRDKIPCAAFSPHLRQYATVTVIRINRQRRSERHRNPWVTGFAVVLCDINTQPTEEAGEAIFCQKTLKGRVAEDDILAISFSPDEKKMTAVDQKDTVTVWDTETGQILAHLVDLNQAPPKGRPVLNISWGDDMLDTFRAHFREVGSPVLRFSDDSEKLAFFSGLSALRTWNVENGRFLRRIGDGKAIRHTSGSNRNSSSDSSFFDIFGGRPVSVPISPDWTRAVVRDGRKRLGLWDVGDGRLVMSLERREANGGGEEGDGSRDMIRHIAFSPDSRWLVTASDKDLAIRDAATGAECKAVTVGLSWPLRSVTFWPDSRRVVTVSDERVLQFWDVESGAMVKALEGHTGRHTNAS